MQCYDLYGTKTLSITELRDAIESALTIRFSPHDSVYYGGEYFRAGEVGGEELVIQLNTFEYGGSIEVAEPDHRGYPVIFWVAWTERGDELRERLATIGELDFLRRKLRR